MYRQIKAIDVPESVSFSNNPREQGQAIEWQYGSAYHAGEGSHGDPYAKKINRSTGRTTYYKWVLCDD